MPLKKMPFFYLAPAATLEEGHGFSRAEKASPKNPALAAGERFSRDASKRLPQWLKPILADNFYGTA